MSGIFRRRQAALSTACLLSLCAAPAALAQAVPGFMKFQETERLAGGTYAFRQGAYRSLFVVGENGVAITDPVSTVYAKAFREEIAKVTDRPVRYVVYSHSHWDRIGGGQIFKDEGAKFVAQERCAENLQETPNAYVIPPDITYAKTYRVKVGGKSLDLYYFGPSLDNCLSVIVARPAKMMMIVNLVSPPHANVPWNATVPDYQLYNIVPFFRAAENLAQREGIETLVGGFIAVGAGPDGKPFLQPSAGPIAAVTEQRQFWEKLFGAVKAQLDAGTPARDIAKQIDQSQFSQYQRYSERNIEILTRRVASMYITGR